MKEKKQDIIKIFIIVILTVVGMYLFWSIKLQGYSMPIQHTVNYSGEFTTRLGAVREIVIRYPKMEETVEIDILVYDSNHEKCWEKSYEDVVITGKNQTLDSFEKENPLELPKGSYYSQILINGENCSNLNCRFIEYSGSYKGIYTILCIFLILGEIVVFLLYRNAELPLERVYFCMAIMLGFILNFVMPPLGVPDEQSHFMEAYELSSKIMRNEQYDENGYLMIREEDYNSIFYLHNTASIAEWYDTFHIVGKESNETMVPIGYKSGVSAKFICSYLPSAIGITVARILGLSGHLVLIMGRLFNLVWLSFLIMIAIKIIPYAKYYYLVIAMLPEVIYLFTSYSYDGFNLALCMLIVAYFLKLYMQKEQICVKQVLILSGLLLMMIPIKMVYVFVGLLLFLLPIKKNKFSIKKIVAVCIIAIVVLGGFVTTNLPRVLSLLGNFNSPIDYSDANQTMTVGFVMQNKEHSLLVLLNTIFANTNTYFNNALGEIVGSGRYDGLDCFVLPSWMICVIVILMIVGLEDTRVNTLSNRKRLSVIVIGIFMYMAVLASMFFAFTSIVAHRITGIQGRYFLPIFILFPLILKNNFFEVKKNKRSFYIVGMGGINLLVLFLIFFYYAHNYFA